MSCYEWERGTFILPSKEWAGFKKAIREAYNKLQAEAFDHAERIYKGLKEKAKGKRKISQWEWSEWFRNLAKVSKSNGYGMYEESVPFQDKIWSALGMFDVQQGKAKRPTRPKKKDFPKATNKTDRYSVGDEAMIAFDNKSRTAYWSVEENNHACDDARKNALAQVFFQQLNRVNWTRGTGGIIVGNDEYNRDNRESGGGANYTKGQYGPKDKKGYLKLPKSLELMHY